MNDKRECDRFNMGVNEFQEYKFKKKTRVLWYILWMVVVSIFNDRTYGYIYITGWLMLSYLLDNIREKRWIEEGSVRNEDLR